MAGALSTYGFINAKLRARISKILPSERMEEIIRAKTLPEAVAFLRGTDFEPVEVAFSSTGDLCAMEARLFGKEVALHTELLRHVEEPVLGLVLALCRRYEADTLKDALRLWFDRVVRGRDIGDKAGYLHRARIVNAIGLDAIILAPDLDTVESVLAGTGWGGAVREGKARVASLGSIFPVELAIDREYYRQLFAAIDLLAARDREIARRMVGVEVDMQNIGWAVRFRTYFELPAADALGYLIPYGFSAEGGALRAAFGEAWARGSPAELLSGLLGKGYGRFAAFLGKAPDNRSRLVLMERILHEITLEEVRRLLAGYPFTIGVILAYFVLKRNEIRAIMTLLNAKSFGLPEDRTRNAL